MKLPDGALTLLSDLEEQPWNKELLDPGLHPGFQLFISNWMADYLRCAPGRINALLSGYNLNHNPGDLKRACRAVPSARELFLDSGAITTLLHCVRGNGTPQDVRDWLACTPKLIDTAWLLHEAGGPAGVLAAMDLPAYSDLLAAADLTVGAAHDITLDNAVTMLEAQLPPGWWPLFTSQGVTLEDHLACMGQYEEVGVLDAVRSGRAWLAVGGMAFETSPDRVHGIHRAIREFLGDQGHIHALGVSRLDVLVPMIRHGWVQSADSSSPAQMVRYNRGIYHLDGPRPMFLVEALHAVSALYHEAELATALKKANGQPLYVQDGLGWEGSVA